MALVDGRASAISIRRQARKELLAVPAIQQTAQRCPSPLVLPSEIYRVLKNTRFCVSFYGWSRVDANFRYETPAPLRSQFSISSNTTSPLSVLSGKTST